MKKSLIYLVAFATVFGLLPVVNLNFASAQGCDPDALKPVRYGQSGSAVKNAQACLIEAGYDIPAGATGYYGSQTRSAVQAFYEDWYGPWSGNSLGPRGVTELKNMLAAGGTQEETPEETPEGTGGTQGTGGTTQQPTQPNQLSQILMLMLPFLGVQLDATSSAQLMQALANNDLTTAMSIITQARGQQQQTGGGEEGFLTVEKDPTIGVVTLREGETGRVAGLRFRADSGAVTVKSIFLRWTGNAAPFRVISNLALKDSSGNVLYQTNASSFLQDSNLNYYLPISGLNINVPKNGQTSVFVEVTVVGTLPSGVNSLSLEVKSNDVRGVDGAGIDRFAPSSAISWSASLSAALAGNAYFVVSRNINSPVEGYVIGDVATQRTNPQNPPVVYKFDVTAKNDSFRVTQVSGSVSNTSTIAAVYLRYGNTVVDVQSPAANNGSFTFNVTPANIVINRDQTVTFDILADFVNGSTSTESQATVSLSSISGLNSLGDVKTTPVSLTSANMHFLLVGPEISVVRKSISATKDQSNSTTTISTVEFSINIKAVGGPLYVSTTGVATITVENRAGASSTASVGPSVVTQGETTVQPQSGWYVIPEGSTYTFKFTTGGQTFSGVSGVRAGLQSLRWGPSQSTQFTANFLGDNFNYWTNNGDYASVQ